MSLLPDESLLQLLFAEMNVRHFHGEVPSYAISYNRRFSSVAGRITYRPPKIELSRSHMLKHPDQLSDTLLHEMIHAWCYAKCGETGHGALFKKKMREVGLASIYHEMGVARDFDPTAKRYLLRCDHCSSEVLRRRRPPEAISCAKCGRGRFNSRYLMRVFEITGLSEVPPKAQPLSETRPHWPSFLGQSTLQASLGNRKVS